MERDGKKQEEFHLGGKVGGGFVQLFLRLMACSFLTLPELD